MKILILGTEARYRAYQPDMPFIGRQELVFLDKDSTEDTILAAGGDAEVLFVDAITPVPGALMERMPRLRLVHSEGVAFDRIDLAAARDRGIYVCNNRGCNAGAVAEQAILLMLMLLRRALEGDRAVREGRQMEMKERCMVEGLTELSACKVGLVGFGDIARAAAERLAPFGCELYYYTKHRRTPEEERKYGITYLPLEELAERSDIVSLHCAVNDETRGMVDDALLSADEAHSVPHQHRPGGPGGQRRPAAGPDGGPHRRRGAGHPGPGAGAGGPSPGDPAAGDPAEGGPGAPSGRHHRGVLPPGPCPHVAQCPAPGGRGAAGQRRQRPGVNAPEKKIPPA